MNQSKAVNTGEQWHKKNVNMQANGMGRARRMEGKQGEEGDLGKDN